SLKGILLSMNAAQDHIIFKLAAKLFLVSSFLCILFGQGTHFHKFILHLDGHYDVHAQVHAHESNDQPFQADSKQDTHQHEVNKATDIIGTLRTSLQVIPDVKMHAILSFDEGHELSKRVLDETSTIFDL